MAEEEYVIGGKPRRKETTRRNKIVGGWKIIRWILNRQDGVVWPG
jgi:hypothetical protein